MTAAAKFFLGPRKRARCCTASHPCATRERAAAARRAAGRAGTRGGGHAAAHRGGVRLPVETAAKPVYLVRC
ncbi:hypothetical protein WJ02_05390 [Burkholderia vietnamiensis]|nr:hypothetical protein WJ02_05390 [Burkholderia vietnamiensis]